MDEITLDDVNKRRIQKYIKRDGNLYQYRYNEKDIDLLEKKGILTERLAETIFVSLMVQAQGTRDIITPNGEFKDELEGVFQKFDRIPKPAQYEKYGYYENSYNDMELQEMYSHIQTCFEVREMDQKYYKCRDLRSIADTVINSINSMEKYQISLNPGSKEELNKIQGELSDLLKQNHTDIDGLKTRIDKYNEYAMQVWNNYLTDVEYEDGILFRNLVHNTGLEIKGAFSTKYMSTSLMTDNIMGVYGTVRTGLIIKPKHIVSASYKDTYTNNNREDEDELFKMGQAILLPQEIEELCMQETIRLNGEILNNEHESVYPEIVVDDYEIEGIYYVTNGEGELNAHYNRVKRMAEDKGVPLVERDISEIRKQKGLEPMTDTTKRFFCQNILSRCCEQDKDLYSRFLDSSTMFVDRHYEEFYEKYMKLKEGDYTKEDILKAFSDVAREDRQFGDVSKKIDEMYMDSQSDTLEVDEGYKLTGIKDSETLQHKLEQVVSDGIFYGSRQSQESINKFNEIKECIPEFDKFKDVYLKLRQEGIEARLYDGIDFENLSYTKLMERAERIVEEQEKLSHEEKVEEIAQSVEETEIPRTSESESISKNKFEINEFGEIVRGDTLEAGKPDANVAREYEETVIEPKKAEYKIAEPKNEAEDLWMKRFKSWYTAIDRVPKDVKTKLVKMRQDIVSAIGSKVRGKNMEIDSKENRE